MARTGMIALNVALVVALSGCFTASEGNTNFSVADDAPAHVDAGGDYLLKVLVTAPDGTPLEGAAIVFFTSDTEFSNEGWWANSFTTYDPVAAVRTGSDGVGSADLEGPGVIHVAAGGLDDYTVEVRFAVVIDKSGEATVEMPLYPNRIEATQAVTVDNLVGRGGIMEPSTQSFRLKFSDDSATDAALHERVNGLHLDLRWTNGPTTGADFFVGIAAGNNEAFITGDDEQQIPMDGANTESVSLPSTDIEGFRSSIAAQGAYGVVLTDWVALGMNGIPATFDIAAEFKGSQFTIE